MQSSAGNRRAGGCLYRGNHQLCAAARVDEVRDLLRREQECCSFFSFSVKVSQVAIRVEAAVPVVSEECLDEFERMASRALGTPV
jgi:hypothetical protein